MSLRLLWSLPGRFGTPFLALGIATAAIRPAAAHEGHAPLPTKGVTVQGDHLLLAATAAKALGLKTTKIALGDLEDSIGAGTTVEVPCHHHAYATTMVRGKVVEVLAHPGDQAAVGQELARVESLALEELQLGMLQAYEALQLAETLLKQRERVANSIPIQTLLESRATRLQKAAEYGVAWQKLRALGLSEQQLETIRNDRRPQRTLAITSPIDGVVADADVRIGQIVEPSEHLYHIVDRREVWLLTAVLESDSAAVRLGMPASVQFEVVPAQRYSGKIDYIPPVADFRTHTVAARITVENPGDMLRPGMFGKMSITVAKVAQGILCPTDALQRDSQGEFVLLEEGLGKYLRRPLKIGLRTRQFVEIRDGLFPGDRVVTTGNHELAALFGTPAVSKLPGTAQAPPTVPPAMGNHNSSQAKFVIPAQVELPTNRKVFASSTVQGKITRLLAERGQRVARGTILAEVESLDLKTLQLDFVANEVLLHYTQQWLDRLNTASAQATIPEKDILAVKSKHLTYRNTQRSLAQKLRMMGLSEKDLARLEQVDLTKPAAGENISVRMPILAPADGTIADFEIALGQVVNPNGKLFEIVDSSRVWVKGFLFEHDAARISLNQDVEVDLVSDPAYRARARITRISPVAASTERAICVWAELENPELRAKEGMLARIVLPPTTVSGLAEHP